MICRTHALLRAVRLGSRSASAKASSRRSCAGAQGFGPLALCACACASPHSLYVRYSAGRCCAVQPCVDAAARPRRSVSGSRSLSLRRSSRSPSRSISASAICGGTTPCHSTPSPLPGLHARTPFTRLSATLRGKGVTFQTRRRRQKRAEKRPPKPSAGYDPTDSAARA